jgi:precorrin-2 dehydrogenase/sirohydrochlorin ferrochelatase
LVVVIGGGKVGLRKTQGLLEAGARVRVVDPKPSPETVRLAAKRKIELIRRGYRRGDLGRAFAAVAATEDPELHRAIRREAMKKKILLNVVDRPAFCDFVFPARFSRGEFLIAVSTGGASPALAKKIREELEKRFGPEYGLLTKLMALLRPRLPSGKRTGRLFSRFVRSPVLARLKRSDWAGVDRLLQRNFGDGLTVRTLGLGRKP